MLDEDATLHMDASAPEQIGLASLTASKRLGAVQEIIVKCYEELLGTAIADRDEQLVLGSLEAVELSAKVELAIGVPLSVQPILEGASITEVAKLCAEALGVKGAEAPMDVAEAIVGNPAERYDPFPLTAIQQAYLIGRQALFDLGGVSTHFYIEIEGRDVDMPRLQLALRHVIARHDALRTTFLPDGTQQTLRDVPEYEIEFRDLSDCDPAVASAELARVRKEMSHQLLPADRWPLFDVRGYYRPDGVTVVHFSIDLLIADAQSVALMFHEWGALYQDLDADLPKPGVTFRDYVLSVEDLKDSPAYASARSYWLERLPTLPPPPGLPLAKQPSKSDGQRVRRERILEREVWTRLKERATSARVTSSVLLCAAYGEVLGAWSETPRFIVNTTLGTRLPLHPDVGRVIGDFTSSILLEVQADGADTFKERASRLQQQFYDDLSNKLFSGVEVQRELARANGTAAATMPVVFTSLLGMPFPETEGDSTFPSSLTYGISQTPQVHLDHVVFERDGELYFTWDAVEDLFPPGVLDGMFNAYCDLLVHLASSRMALNEQRPRLLPSEQSERRRAVNQTRTPIDAALMIHTLVDERCQENADAVAIIARDRTMSYGELDRRGNQVARALQAHGAGPDKLVGVIAEKGWEQLVAVLGTVRSGGAYLPIDPQLPPARVRFLLEHGEVQTVLTQSALALEIDWPQAITTIAIDGPEISQASADPVDCAATPSNLAYVIFTSGSTGIPKGVMIEHAAAVNTLLDCLARYEITAEDRVLALSALSFDLSVFDVFGVLGAGGVVVMPDREDIRDPERWAELIREHQVTIWNSVPALFDTLITYVASRAETIGGSLRLAMLSGDWIPVELPSRLAWFCPTSSWSASAGRQRARSGRSTTGSER